MTECSDHVTKVCNKCKEIKNIFEFNKNPRRNKFDGHDVQCKKCVNNRSKAWRENNVDRCSDVRKLHYQKNIDKMRSEKRTYILNHKEDKIQYDIEYRRMKKVEIATYKKEWAKKNKDNPQYKIRRNIRRRMHHALMGKNKSANTMELLGCSIEEFKTYLESLWSSEMTWDNYGVNGWHIDHIKECYTFDLSDPSQQRKCFHFSNQRPLWAKDNLSRSREKYWHNKNKESLHQSHQE